LVNLGALQRKTSSIPRVEDYYGGVAHTELTVPDYILLFARQTPELLGTLRQSFDHHHRFVLIINLQTPGSVGVDRQVVRLVEGQAVLVFPHQFHHYLNLEKDRLNWLFVTFEVADPSTLAALKNLRIDLSARALELLEYLVDCTLQPGFKQTGIDNQLALWLALVLDELLAISRSAPRAPKAGVRETQAEIFVERVHQYLLSHMAENFTLGELARSLKMSESYLRSLFRRHFGVSVGHYVRESRIAKACGLIHNSDLNFSQIADQCGFDSLYSFSRAFKRAYGISPRDYRHFVRNSPQGRLAKRPGVLLPGAAAPAAN
jgi:AraC-like DNA-binding protein